MPDSFLGTNKIFQEIYCFLGGTPETTEICSIQGILPSGYSWVSYFLAGFAIMFILANAFMLGAAVFVYSERRLLGKFQLRTGPNRVGPFGLLQPIADILKLLMKEDIVPNGADKPVHTLAPIVMLAPAILVTAVIPFGEGYFLANLNVGLLYILAMSGMITIAIFMAGWSCNNRYALFGCMRGVAQLISYELPIVFSMVGILILTGSLSLLDVVQAQKIPFIFVQPMAFVIFLIGTSAELNRTPFDIVEAESEIIAGYHTEYSGIKFALFQAAEMGSILVSGAVVATLFFQGWKGPFLPGPVWFLIKVYGFVFLMIWVRATLPRLRVDQIMEFAWQFLLPLSLINIFVTATSVFLLGDVENGIRVLDKIDLLLVGAINLFFLIACVFVGGLFMKTKASGSRSRESLVAAFDPGTRGVSL